MKRFCFLLYGVAAYLAFLGAVAYAVGFTGNLFVTKSLDSAQRVSLPAAIFTNLAILLLFVWLHGIMARPSFKKLWNKHIPAPVERSTYILLVSISLVMLMLLWQPLGGVVWTVTGQAGKGFLLFFFFLGWSLVFLSTFLGNHFGLFGLRQVWEFYNDRPHEATAFRTSFFYRFVRHPLYFGFLLAAWCAPVMTVAHLLMAIVCTAYVLVTIQFDEKDLASSLGAMLIPFGKKKVM
jgi:protein-S-isoprenylcysteine O-methyltransferase Ste14